MNVVSLQVERHLKSIATDIIKICYIQTWNSITQVIKGPVGRRICLAVHEMILMGAVPHSEHMAKFMRHDIPDYIWIREAGAIYVRLWRIKVYPDAMPQGNVMVFHTPSVL